MSDRIRFSDVSKFYGEVLGVNRVDLAIPPGITSLVGPNGSGKSTLLNLMTGLLQPSRGSVEILGIPTTEPERLFRQVGYCTQFDSFPRGMTGLELLRTFLALHGFERADVEERAWRALELVGMTDAARRRIAGYSKGMRQRIKLAHSLAHDPPVLILDEPLNGLDPMGRAEAIDLFRRYASEGRHVIVSSHILHEVDVISDQVVLINGGYVVAEGAIRAVRGEIAAHPMQILVRCDRPRRLATRLFDLAHVVQAEVLEDDGALLVQTRDADAFSLAFNDIVLEESLQVETFTPADEDVSSVYDYLIGAAGSQA